MEDLSGILGGTQNLVLIATAVPVIIVVAILVGVVVRGRRKAQRVAQNWAVTTGQIVTSGAQAYRTRSGNSGMTTMYRPAVSYVYTVNGQQYASDRLHLGPGLGYGSAGTAEQMVARYSPGALVEVHFDPQNPADAVLETRVGGSRVLWVVALILIAILVVTAVMTLSMGSFLSGVLGNFFR